MTRHDSLVRLLKSAVPQAYDSSYQFNHIEVAHFTDDGKTHMVFFDPDVLAARLLTWMAHHTEDCRPEPGWLKSTSDGYVDTAVDLRIYDIRVL